MEKQIASFYNDMFGPPALAKFVDVGRRRNHSPEHTLTAAQMIYETHQINPFPSPKIIGHMVHATAARLHRERTATELDILNLIVDACKVRSFREKFNNWMRWGKWQ